MLAAVHARDVLGMVQAATAARVDQVAGRARAAEHEAVALNEQNVALARLVVETAVRVREERTEDVQDERMRKRLEEVDVSIAEKRREWRLMKSLVAGIIVGSGVDWAADEKLVELVLDDEDELR